MMPPVAGMLSLPWPVARDQQPVAGAGQPRTAASPGSTCSDVGWAAPLRVLDGVELLVRALGRRGRIKTMTDNGRVSWSVLMPVKVLAQAKSRLAGRPGWRDRAGRARARAGRAIPSPRCSGHAVAVSSSSRMTRSRPLRLGRAGAQVVLDEPRAGLNAALRHGAAHRPPGGLAMGRLGAVRRSAALRPEHLGRALRAAAGLAERVRGRRRGRRPRCLTRLAPGAAFRPGIGLASQAEARRRRGRRTGPGRHRRSRRDVDTPHDLRGAAELGLGGTARPSPPNCSRCAPWGR